jgi:hypothetical protein
MSTESMLVLRMPKLRWLDTVQCTHLPNHETVQLCYFPKKSLVVIRHICNLCVKILKAIALRALIFPTTVFWYKKDEEVGIGLYISSEFSRNCHT